MNKNAFREVVKKVLPTRIKVSDVKITVVTPETVDFGTTVTAADGRSAKRLHRHAPGWAAGAGSAA
ncbi:MAG: hypothetical protein GY798_21320 [Hyphomicrobiales bacterium]|nr:hypothetical protein [Hyphomicrobiales bacterium]